MLLATLFETHGISEAITARLRALGLKTVQDLERWLDTPVFVPGEPARFRRLTDVPGIKVERAEEIRGILLHAQCPDIVTISDR